MQIKIGPTRISCAHFLDNLEPAHKCRRIHGHNYIIQAILDGEPSQDGTLLEASRFKNLVSSLDHMILIPNESANLEICADSSQVDIMVMDTNKFYTFPSSDVLLLPVISTTAEYLAAFLASETLKLGDNIQSVTITVEETETLSATVTKRRIP